jgi:hypothetical protein
MLGGLLTMQEFLVTSPPNVICLIQPYIACCQESCLVKLARTMTKLTRAVVKLTIQLTIKLIIYMKKYAESVTYDLFGSFEEEM